MPSTTILSPTGLRRKVDTLWTKISRLHNRTEHPAASEDTQAARLPPELTDTIIDHLRTDKDALTACALVCSAFLNRSFYHLYHTMGMRDTRRLRRFVEFLPAATLRRYVRTMRLGNARTGDANRLRLEWGVLEGLVGALPCLVCLELDCLTWTVAPSAAPNPDSEWVEVHPASDDTADADTAHTTTTTTTTVQTPAPPPKAVHQLIMNDVRSSASGVHLVLGEMAPLLQLFGAVGRLTVSGAHGAAALRQAPPALGSTVRALRIRHLTLQADAFNAPFLELLRRTESVRALKTVHVDAVDRATLVALGHLLRDARRVVAVVQVDVMRLGPPNTNACKPEELCEAVNIPANLSGCTSLHTLRFWVPMSDGMGTIGTWHWRFVFAVLTDAVAHLPNIENIVLCISLGKDPARALAYTREVDWSGLEMLLRKLPRLTYVGLGTPGPQRRSKETRGTDEKLWRIAKRRMPVLYANRVLRWKHTYTD